LFVTGRLAEPALRRVLSELDGRFSCDVTVLKITVAALMTTNWIARAMQRVPEGTGLVLIPGLCEGDPRVLEEQWGVPVEKGPKDLRAIPEYFGRAERVGQYGNWDIEIVAEINNAPKLTRDAIRRRADYFLGAGADIIDIGCTPGLHFPQLASVIRELTLSGVRVSVDTFDIREIREAVDSGAELVLSINNSNIEAAHYLRGSQARAVVVPDLGGSVDTLQATIKTLTELNVRYLIDPILEPIGFGFMASLGRYAEVRRHYPDAEMLMGIGNLTEMTAADTTGVNALLVAVCQELGIRSVLTTEVIPWAHGVVREVDVARRLMHYAIRQQVVPKGIDDRLVTVKDPVVLTYTEDELRALQSSLSDPNYRIFSDTEAITVFNNERFVRWTDMSDLQGLFRALEVDDPGHAFYLGKELARASLAVTLGKSYRQEGSLSWGYLTPTDDHLSQHFKGGTKSARSSGRASDANLGTARDDVNS
jgi:dihydropteroate synthase-like protein